MALTLETVWELLSILPLKQRERFFNGVYDRLSNSESLRHRIVAEELKTFKDEILSDEPDPMEDIIGNYAAKTGSEILDLLERKLDLFEEKDEKLDKDIDSIFEE